MAADPAPVVSQAVPFFHVADMARSLAFYVDGLGFQLRNKWVVDGAVRWCWLVHGETALMLQQFPAEGHDSWRPEGKVGEGVSIFFLCDDALVFYRYVKARGIEAKRPFVGNGCWVVGLVDPDGYRLEFESRTDAPEHSEYREDEPQEA